MFCFLTLNLLSTVLSTKKPSPFSHYYVCILKDHINVCVMLVCCWRWMFVCFSIFIFMAIYILFDQKPFWRFDSSKITARYWTKKTMMIPFKALYHKSYPTYSNTIEEKYRNYLMHYWNDSFFLNSSLFGYSLFRNWFYSFFLSS